MFKSRQLVEFIGDPAWLSPAYIQRGSIGIICDIDDANVEHILDSPFPIPVKFLPDATTNHFYWCVPLGYRIDELRPYNA